MSRRSVLGVYGQPLLKPMHASLPCSVVWLRFFYSGSHSEPLLKTLRLLKFSDIIHLEILSFVYQWYHKLSPSCFVNYFTQYLQFIHIIHVNHGLIICLLNLFIPLNTAFVLSVTLVQNFGILYLLMLRKSSRFPVFVNISRIL